MNMKHKTYRFRLIPNKKQQTLLAKHFGSVRFVYNHFLSERIEQYNTEKKFDNYFAQARVLTQLKKQSDKIWLNEVNSQALTFALKSLDTTFINFFKKCSKFPRFKSLNHKNSFTVPQYGKIEGDRIRIPKFKKGIKVRLHRKVEGKIGKMTITRTQAGKYFVCIFTQQEIKQLPKIKKAIGVDLGIKDFAITSDGKKFKNNRYTNKYALQLKKAQKHLSRKKKGSNGFENQRRKVAKVYEKISNSRLDNLHKVSSELVRDNQIIVVENLNVRGMIEDKKLSKPITDASWGTFLELLHYKCDHYGRKLIKVDRFLPSSKICNACGWINEDLSLADREWTCGNGHHLDRDINAAKNILKEGWEIYRQGLSITKVEENSVYYSSTSYETPSLSIASA
ncbi:RNA-guided endonuclease TnpB family protein [Galbibacter sp.]|uniref:RNA-guided endonuclease TnpB family protein n=1 Tax=Galbibacter sp. TaxID=2918471 RepID=UPI003A8EE12C